MTAIIRYSEDAQICVTDDGTMNSLILSVAMLGIFAGVIGYVGSIVRDAAAIQRDRESKRRNSLSTTTSLAPAHPSGGERSGGEQKNEAETEVRSL